MRALRRVRGFPHIGCVLAIAFLLVLQGCGGSGGSPAVVVPPPSVSVSIASHPAGVNAGLTYHFVASVLHTTNTTVNWAVSCSCTGIDVGVILPDGTYVAPLSVSQETTLTVTATSVADSTKSASVQFMLMAPVRISLNPSVAQVVLGFSHQFSVNVENDLDNRGVQWLVADIPGGNATLGTIDSTGVYTAPSGSSEMIVAVTAKSVTDPSKTASTTFALIVNAHPNFTGDYTFRYTGPDGIGLTAAAGTIHLNGAGRLSATLDINSGLNNNVLAPGVAVTGFYGFEHNNLGHATLNYTVGQVTASISFRLALLSNSMARLLEFDGQGDGIGVIEKQASSGLSTSLDGPRVLVLTGLNTAAQFNRVATLLGAFTGSGGSLSGIFDAAADDSSSSYDQKSFSGAYSFGTSNTLSLTFEEWNHGTAIPFRIYPVSPDKAFVMSTGMPVLTGAIEKQTGGPYHLPAFAGTWIFSVQATDSSYHLAGGRLVRVRADGSGLNAIGDMYDNGSYSVLDGPPYPVTFTQYHVAENGRGNANAQFAMPETVVWYWVTSERGYIMCNNAYGSSNGYGEFFRQQDAPFSSASLQEPLSIVLHGYSDYFFMPKQDSHLGIGMPDGAGNFLLTTSDVDAKDYAEPIKMDVVHRGTYTIDSDGRGLINLDNGQFLLRFYAASEKKLLLLRPGYDMIGAGTAEQPSFPAE